ncbi:hypothetical protein BJ138DRAFT_1103330 [Hygrophoropsis aurantiaca]|uniref:Uncharacterized protein n=1 Tax=Hygrophoropsis aurantiaca TaxID=72124 RepID=A0ACB8A7K5_9AGAM|nr:hypothetical protein BJ138DRAFT_1103330 [Hygrophoropsis aurantiaca]
MSHATQISRLGNELTLFTTSISLGDEPHHWLENNASQILTISSIDRKDYGEIKLIYPVGRLRLYVYTREIVKSSNAKLVNALTRLYLGWTTNVDEKHRQNTGPSSQATSHSRTLLSRASTLPNRKSIIEWEENILDRILKLDAQCVAAHLLVLLKDPERRSLLLSVKDQAAQSLLDLFQELLGLLHLRGIRSYLVSALLELSRNSGLYPEELLLRNVNTRGLHPVCGGTFGNICKGILGGHAVAIKVMRAFQDVNKCIKVLIHSI